MEPIRSVERVAAPQRFVLWIDTAVGECYCVPEQFDTEWSARRAADAIYAADRPGQRLRRVAIYDDIGATCYTCERV